MKLFLSERRIRIMVTATKLQGVHRQIAREAFLDNALRTK